MVRFGGEKDGRFHHRVLKEPYLFDSGDVLLHHATVQALDLAQPFTHAISAKRAEGPREYCRIRALHTHTIIHVSQKSQVIHASMHYYLRERVVYAYRSPVKGEYRVAAGTVYEAMSVDQAES